MIGQTLNLHYTTVTERAFFQNGDKGKHSNEAINEDIWFIVDIEFENIEWINIKNKTK